MGNYYQPEIETMPLPQLQALQSERLVAQVKHVYENVEFYRDRMDAAGVKPEDIHGICDLHKLPFVTKDDLRDQYPYGLLGVPLSECVRIQSTSGTTGRRVVAFYTQEDIDLWDDCCARAIVAAGGTREDVCHVCQYFFAPEDHQGAVHIHAQHLIHGHELAFAYAAGLPVQRGVVGHLPAT